MAAKPVIGINMDFRSSCKEHASLSFIAAGYYDNIIQSGGIPLVLPPLDHVEIRGDVLLMRVAETEEEGKEGEETPNVSAFLSNEEFFLDYTLDEYVKFASRTDIVAKEPEASEEEGEEESEEEEDGEDEGVEG